MTIEGYPQDEGVGVPAHLPDAGQELPRAMGSDWEFVLICIEWMI
jgi:hypothetical protein